MSDEATALPRRPSTLWQKGVSANPGGRPKQVAHVVDLARTHTTKAIETLAAIMVDEKATRVSRIAAANALLDRAWGRPAQSVGVSIDQSSPNGEPIPDWDVARRIAFALAMGLKQQQDAQLIRDTAAPAEIVQQIPETGVTSDAENSGRATAHATEIESQSTA